MLTRRSPAGPGLPGTLGGGGNAGPYARIMGTRGEGRFGLAPPLAEGLSRLIVIVRPLEPPAPEQYERGLQLAVTQIRRNPPQALDPALKTGNYLNSALALRESHAAGADDALLLGLHGQVTEASTSNVFFVNAGGIVTPPRGGNAGGRHPRPGHRGRAWRGPA